MFQVERSASCPPMSHMRKCVFHRTISSTLLPMVGDVWTTSFIRLGREERTSRARPILFPLLPSLAESSSEQLSPG